MRLPLWVLVCIFVAPRLALAQVPQNGIVSARPCHAKDLELFNEGGGAAAGHETAQIGLRNMSSGSCTLLGTPQLEFLDQAGRSLAVPYAKNEDDFQWPKQPVRLVTLAPGEFASFLIGTTTGNQSLQFASMRVLLPGDDTPLFAGDFGEGGLQSIDVSAIVAGVESDFAAPTKHIAAVSGASEGVSVSLDVPQHPQMGFDAHFAFRNTGDRQFVMKPDDCKVHEELTNSAGKTVTSGEPCGLLMGETNSDGVFRPGTKITTDLTIGGEDDNGFLQMCRVGQWTAKLSLETPFGIVRYPSIPFQVSTTMCSDSLPSGKPDIDPKAIHWEAISSCGVRVGIAPLTDRDVAPESGRSITGNPIPVFHLGQVVKLKMYLDNLTDDLMELRAGGGAFRVVVRRAGMRERADIEAPMRVPANDGQEQMAVSPHTWRYIQTIVLNDSYVLSPDDYNIMIGPLTLTGTAACANAATTGWPYTPQSVIESLLIEVSP